MSKFLTRRKFIGAGVAGAGGGAAAYFVNRYGLVPPDHAGIIGIGETLTYDAQRLATVLDLVGTLPEARYVVSEPFANPNQAKTVVRVLWDSIDMADALHPQTMLAYGMNGEAIPLDHGAPVRLRMGRHLGYKNTKFLSRIVVTNDRDFYRKGRGTWYGGI